MQDLQSRDDVGDLGYGQQTAEADDLDRDTAGFQCRSQRRELSALPAQHSDVARLDLDRAAIRPWLTIRRQARG